VYQAEFTSIPEKQKTPVRLAEVLLEGFKSHEFPLSEFQDQTIADLNCFFHLSPIITSFHITQLHNRPK